MNMYTISRYVSTQLADTILTQNPAGPRTVTVIFSYNLKHILFKRTPASSISLSLYGTCRERSHTLAQRYQKNSRIKKKYLQKSLKYLTFLALSHEAVQDNLAGVSCRLQRCLTVSFKQKNLFQLHQLHYISTSLWFNYFYYVQISCAYFFAF